MPDKPIVVFGAGGLFGRYVSPELAKRGAHVRGVVHHEAGEAVARAMGVNDVVYADLRDEAALKKALDGAGGVYYMPPKFLPDEEDIGIRLVQLAKSAGVERFVLSGVMHPYLTELHNHRAKLPVARELVISGLDFTILLPTSFMQSIGAFFWDKVLATGGYVEPWAQDQQVSWVDYRDVAEVAARALTEPGLGHALFELAASGTYSREDVCELMGEALGREIEPRSQPFDEWFAENMPPDPDLRESFQNIDTFYSKYGFPGDNSLVLRTILGREPRTMRGYIEELVAESLKGAAT
jgi:uncharacterized protein YbjT (DUF2867 family)